MSTPDYNLLLASFKRSNKGRRLKMALKAGYKGSQEYLNWLVSQTTVKTSSKSSTKKTSTKATTKATKKESKVESPKQLKSTVKAPPTDLVIAFDTTGSMSGYIGQVKTHVKELIPSLLSQNPDLQISVVAFGDYFDMKGPNSFGKAYQFLDLTKDVDTLIKFVAEAKNTSGGDEPEFYELVIQKIINETSWRSGSNRSVLLIADANPHQPGYKYASSFSPSPDWRGEAQRAASSGIKFDTLRIHPHVNWYEELSKITGGICLDFSSSSKTSKLVEATALARGGVATEAAFMARSMDKDITADVEMSSVYSMYKTTLKK